MPENTVIVSYGGGCVESRIDYNPNTQKWEVDFLCMDCNDPTKYAVNPHKEKKEFDTPIEALLWIAENEIRWE